MAMADDAFGVDTCLVNGGVVHGVDREWGEAGPDDAESRDVPSVDGDADRLLDGDGGPADNFGCIAGVDKEVCVDANDHMNAGIAGRSNDEVAVAGTEGAIGSRVDVDTKDVDFEHFVAATRAFSINSCCISSLVRAFRDSLSPHFLVGFPASCLFLESLNSIWCSIGFEDPFWSSAFANCSS